MHNVANLQENSEGGPSLDDLVSSLNVDQTKIFGQVKKPLGVMHESGTCKCTVSKPMHMFISGVGGTGKSFLMKKFVPWCMKYGTTRKSHSLTGLAAFNVGRVTIH